MLQMTVFSGHLSCLSSTVLGVWLIPRYTRFDSSGQDLCPHRLMVGLLICNQCMAVRVRLWALNILIKFVVSMLEEMMKKLEIKTMLRLRLENLYLLKTKPQ